MYIVYQCGSHGTFTTKCRTKKQVWKQLGKGSIGEIYSVESTDSKDVSEFIPF